MNGRENEPGMARAVVYSKLARREAHAMDAGLIIILSVQGVTLLVTVALSLGLLKVLRSDLRDVRKDL